MNRGLVLAVNPTSSVFAVETLEGECAVFTQQSGPRVLAADMLEGSLLTQGTLVLRHVDGDCVVVGASGPVTRSRALEWVRNAGEF